MTLSAHPRSVRVCTRSSSPRPTFTTEALKPNESQLKTLTPRNFALKANLKPVVTPAATREPSKYLGLRDWDMIAQRALEFGFLTILVFWALRGATSSGLFNLVALWIAAKLNTGVGGGLGHFVAHSLRHVALSLRPKLNMDARACGLLGPLPVILDHQSLSSLVLKNHESKGFPPEPVVSASLTWLHLECNSIHGRVGNATGGATCHDEGDQTGDTGPCQPSRQITRSSSALEYGS